MGSYILWHLLLVIPKLIGIILINFTLAQLVPGGPIEHTAAKIQGEVSAGESEYEGARGGLPPEFIAKLEKEFGFDKPPVERFLLMMGNYLQFDFFRAR